MLCISRAQKSAESWSGNFFLRCCAVYVHHRSLMSGQPICFQSKFVPAFSRYGEAGGALQPRRRLGRGLRAPYFFF
jgi:hypothetical protein